MFRSVLLAMALASTFVVAAKPPSDSTPSQATMAADVRRAAKLLAPLVDGRRLVLLGELHGTQEAPELAATLLDRYASRRHPVVLALEVDTQEQPRFDRYLASRGTAADRTALLDGAHWREKHHDGRDSRAMFQLVEHVRALRGRGAMVALVAFDGGGTDMESRNRRMAEVLHATAARFPRASLLVLTGNVHAMTRRPRWEMFDGGRRIAPPMTAGRHLADLHPLSINIQGASGAFWACSAEECRVQPVTRQPTEGAPRLTRDDAGSVWDYDLVLPHFTPSPPAIEAFAAGAAASRAASP